MPPSSPLAAHSIRWFPPRAFHFSLHHSLCRLHPSRPHRNVSSRAPPRFTNGHRTTCSAMPSLPPLPSSDRSTHLLHLFCPRSISIESNPSSSTTLPPVIVHRVHHDAPSPITPSSPRSRPTALTVNILASYRPHRQRLASPLNPARQFWSPPRHRLHRDIRLHFSRCPSPSPTPVPLASTMSFPVMFTALCSPR
jgi:hypothetical protein